MPKKTQVKQSDKRSGIAMIAVLGVIILAVVIIVIIAMTSGGGHKEADTGLIAQIEGYKGYTRYIGQDEYDFFRDLVERDTYGDRTDEEFDELTREYINEVNAKFHLGNKLGLCGPYDFSVLNYDMEQENLSRQIKLQKGEPVYGPQSFNLTTYFEYVYSNLESDILNYMIANADEDMVEKARAFYEEGKDNFTNLVSVTYEMTENGETVTETVDSSGLRNISNADDSLYSILMGGEEGESYDYEYYGVARRVKIIEKVYITPEFDENLSSAMTYYISNEVIDELYETVARNNPVQFDLD